MKKIKYLSKSCKSSKIPWKKFGAPDIKIYTKWSPLVCGIYCFKMIGDFYELTNKKTIYQLTVECKELGGFKELSNKEIQGIFHNPLLKLANNHGLSGKIEKNLNMEKIISSLSEYKFVILSINKSKVNSKFEGGHLILLHGYNQKTNEILVNDPNPILDKKGKNIKINLEKLNQISNRKGLILWLKPQ